MTQLEKRMAVEMHRTYCAQGRTPHAPCLVCKCIKDKDCACQRASHPDAMPGTSR